MISQVVVSEREEAQTRTITVDLGLGLRHGLIDCIGTQLESWTEEGDSPVRDTVFIPSSIQSSAGPEKSCMNTPAPSGKAKYSWETDSELVPWGKGEKNREQRSEIDPETMRLQTVGARKSGDCVPFA